MSTPNTPKKAKAEKEPWSDDHTMALLRATISLILNNRPELYSTPALQGVSDHGGNRINTKLQQILKKVCATYPGAENMVDEEVKKLKEARSAGVSPKKRKAKDEE